MNCNWITEEFLNVDLGDKRLNQRLLNTTIKLGQQPGFSANKACDDWASTKAVYRLFDNDKVNPNNILCPHIEKTIERSLAYPFILAIQDSSGVNFTNHNAKKGMGQIGTGDPRPSSKNAMGLYMHPTLAVSPDGLPLGLLNNYFWKRGDESEEKESSRWTSSIEDIHERAKGELNILSLSDRESDFNNFFLSHREINQHFLIRSRANRKIMESQYKLHEYIRTQKTVLSFEQEVQNKKGKNNRQVKKSQKGRFKNNDGSSSRIAKLNVQYCSVNLILDSGHRNRADIELPVSVIRVFESEREMEEGEYLIDWILITSLEIKSANQAKLMVEYYATRWRIEEFFKILKSGCKVEDSRYKTYERTTRFIALNMVIAWRIFYMSHLERHAGDSPCTSFLTEIEWKALWCRIHKSKELPDKIPTVKEAVRWIAIMGGFLNRKSDGSPGNQSIWIGFKRLNDMAAMLDILSS